MIAIWSSYIFQIGVDGFKVFKIIICHILPILILYWFDIIFSFCDLIGNRIGLLNKEEDADEAQSSVY